MSCSKEKNVGREIKTLIGERLEKAFQLKDSDKEKILFLRQLKADERLDEKQREFIEKHLAILEKGNKNY